MKHEQAVERGEVIEIDLDLESVDEAEIELNSSEVIRMCEQLEKVCFKHANQEENGELSRQLRQFQGQLWQEHLRQQKQVPLDHFWKGPQTNV